MDLIHLIYAWLLTLLWLHVLSEWRVQVRRDREAAAAREAIRRRLREREVSERLGGRKS